MKSNYYLDWHFASTYTDRKYEAITYVSPMGKVTICLYKVDWDPSRFSGSPYVAAKVVRLVLLERDYKFDRWCWRPGDEE